MAWVYLLRCADGSYYAGSTIDLERRLWEHNHSDLGAAYTRRRRPVELARSAQVDRVDEAWAYEKRIQGWNRRKREALIAGADHLLPELSRRKAVQDRQTEVSPGGRGVASPGERPRTPGSHTTR